MRKTYALITAALMFSVMLMGCIYADVIQPLSYRSATISDAAGLEVVKPVEGESCAHLVLWMVGWGDGGYNAAVQDALEPVGASMIYDVKADNHFLNVLYVYQRSCAKVNGIAVK